MAPYRVLGNTGGEASEKAGPPINTEDVFRGLFGHSFVGILLEGELSEVFFMFTGTGIHICIVMFSDRGVNSDSRCSKTTGTNTSKATP